MGHIFVCKKKSLEFNRLDYHPFSTATWCLLQKCYHCVCLSASDTGRIHIVGSIYLFFIVFRNRPFNLKGGLWFFVSCRIFFSDNSRVRIFIFFVALSANFFFQNLTLGYMTKTLNPIIIFFLHQNQNIFFSNIGNQKFFLDKNHNPPSS